MTAGTPLDRQVAQIRERVAQDDGYDYLMNFFDARDSVNTLLAALDAAQQRIAELEATISDLQFEAAQRFGSESVRSAVPEPDETPEAQR